MVGHRESYAALLRICKSEGLLKFLGSGECLSRELVTASHAG